MPECILPGTVGLYSECSAEAMLLLTGLGGGVTHMDFSPDGNLLFVGFRKVQAQAWSVSVRATLYTSPYSPSQSHY